MAERHLSQHSLCLPVQYVWDKLLPQRVPAEGTFYPILIYFTVMLSQQHNLNFCLVAFVPTKYMCMSLNNPSTSGYTTAADVVLTKRCHTSTHSTIRKGLWRFRSCEQCAHGDWGYWFVEHILYMACCCSRNIQLQRIVCTLLCSSFVWHPRLLSNFLLFCDKKESYLCTYSYLL